MKNDSRSPWFIRILSLFFAILLYYNANSFVISNKSVTGTMKELQATAENVPVNVTYNQDKYFISGYQETVSVDLTSNNKILLDKESNAETRGFSVVMDLTKYNVGTHEVPLEVVGLPNSVKGTIKPSKLSVTIENKDSNTFKVEPAIDNKIYQEGYSTNEATIDPMTVKVSGSEASVKEVDRVIAGVSDKTNVTSNFSERVKPYAVNKSGEPLDVKIEPETVSVNVKVTVPSKRVKVTPVQSGTIPKGIKDFTFTIKDDMVDIEGPKEVLDEINGIELKIDTSNIKETVTSSYAVVVPNGVKVIPETVSVTVKPNEVKTSTSDSSSK
ncbi:MULTISPECIES: YbbR-like domain-containing protein [unclassified Vagococcus]|uniref:CdaR family protein n=1 Tax=unclassified Vagococcus TaxID=2648499 RepID=UPI001F514A2D|nr:MULTISPECIES: CdaR family protein [unclassified Vagococcus]MCI0129865.1 CdaR family protein [Vagococcus sp. CY53-2]UNM88716.1 CdaR family protein [Vagococcus sp. CY52-2]